MSAVAPPHRRAGAGARPRRASLTQRLTAALPLASVYLWLCIVYGVESWKRVTPWLFTDELEMTQLSRAIAATGHAARRGEPHSFRSLYTLLIAPVWLIHDVATAYAGIKYLDVFVMTSVLFPTYALARLVVGRWAALFAAAGAAAVPALAYSSWIVEETLAYPYAALCFFLIAKALLERSRGWIAGAVVASALAPLVRGELIVFPIVLALATLFALWSSDRMRERRATWSKGDRLGVLALVAGAIIVIGGVATHYSHQWEMVTSYNWTKHRIFVYGDWAAGSLAIGLGVIPLVAGVASLVAARGEQRSREVRMFRCVAVAGLIGFGLYAAMKAAYLSMVFASRVEERNLIYIAPLLFVGTALVLERRRVNVLALLAAAAYAFYLVVGTPFFMDRQLYSDALGLAIFEQANRYFAWTPTTAQWLALGVLFAGVAAILAAHALRARTALAAGIAAALGLGLVAWNLTGEIAAAAGTNSIGRELEATLRRPFSWVDDVTHGKPTLYLAQGVGDQDPEWELEFWNRSIVTVSSVDGTLGGPGPTGAPNVTPSGEVYWTHDPARPGRVYDYAVEDWPCIDFAGARAATHLYRGGADTLKEWRLIRLTRPNRLRAECSGIYPDGWSGANDSVYFRFTGGRAGRLLVTLSRASYPATPVTVELGDIVERNYVPQLGTVRRRIRFVLPTQVTKVVSVPTPASRFAARVVIESKFSPHGVDPTSGDVRTLGAQIAYRYLARR